METTLFGVVLNKSLKVYGDKFISEDSLLPRSLPTFQYLELSGGAA
jgi:hypothetical protein